MSVPSLFPRVFLDLSHFLKYDERDQPSLVGLLVVCMRVNDNISNYSQYRAAIGPTSPEVLGTDHVRGSGAPVSVTAGLLLSNTHGVVTTRKDSVRSWNLIFGPK